MSRIQLVANNFRPSTMLRRMNKHTGDVSESSKGKVMAYRTILGKRVTFYENGLRQTTADLTEGDEYHSEVLRLAHASLLINDAVGDKRQCWVDARYEPVRVVIYNMPAEEFIKRATELIETNKLDLDFVLGNPLKQTEEKTDVRNVKFFGR